MDVKVPFFMVNPKSYLYGDESFSFAKACDQIAGDTGVSLYFTAPFTELRRISEATRNLIVTAQAMESLKPGRGMGHLLPESLKDAGVKAVFLNHAENPMTVAELSKTILRAQELKMITCVCADSVREARAVAMLEPDILLCEPTDLIGTGKVAGNNYIIETTESIRKINPGIKVMIASGITTAQDVYNVIRLGADGSGATSGVLNAPDPVLRVREIAEAMKKAMKDRTDD